jgi:hypothetical protein
MVAVSSAHFLFRGAPPATLAFFLDFPLIQSSPCKILTSSARAFTTPRPQVATKKFLATTVPYQLLSRYILRKFVSVILIFPIRRNYMQIDRGWRGTISGFLELRSMGMQSEYISPLFVWQQC